jgi:hypothetical protein
VTIGVPPLRIRHIGYSLAVVLLTVVMSGCRLDLDVTIKVEADGTGQVTAQFIADPDLTAALPPGADMLLLSDAREAGWEIEGPTPTDQGGLRVTMSKATASLDDLAIAIAEIGPPFVVEALERRADTDPGSNTSSLEISKIFNSFALTAVLPDGDSPQGFAAFSDPDLTSVMGGVPFGDELLALGATPEESMSLVLRIDAPGKVTAHSGTVTSTGDQRSVVEWQIPLTGAATVITMTSVQSPEGTSWARGLAQILRIILWVWVLVSVTFIAWVLWARQRKARARRLRSLR